MRNREHGHLSYLANHYRERVDAAIEEVMNSTERLAAGKGRYEIHFRANLAELAERLRRT